MLNMYLGQMPDDTVLYNDGFFDLNVDSIVYDKDILFRIDGVKYAGNQRIYSLDTLRTRYEHLVRFSASRRRHRSS